MCYSLLEYVTMSLVFEEKLLDFLVSNNNNTFETCTQILLNVQYDNQSPFQARFVKVFFGGTNSVQGISLQDIDDPEYENYFCISVKGDALEIIRRKFGETQNTKQSIYKTCFISRVV